VVYAAGGPRYARRHFEEIIKLTAAPTREVPFTTGRELGVGAAMDLGSPALSAIVFRLGSGSPTITIINKLQSNLMRVHHLHGGPNLCLRLGGGIFEAGFDRALLWDSEISASFPGDGIRLGGRICDVRIYWRANASVN